MTTDQPLRFELEIELPGTPEQVWDAIATGPGISSWFLPSDVVEHLGGHVEFHMGPGASSEGEVTAWEPPQRFGYAEPGWAELTGRENTGQTPMVSEFVVEAVSGGSCVLRVVTSAFGTGADWEDEFFEEMGRYWRPSFDTLREYLTRFPGQHATVVERSTTVEGVDPADLWTVLAARLGSTTAGDRVDVAGAAGSLHRWLAPPDAMDALVVLDPPLRGMVTLVGIGGDGQGIAVVRAHLFGETAATDAESWGERWQDWLDALTADAAQR